VKGPVQREKSHTSPQRLLRNLLSQHDVMSYVGDNRVPISFVITTQREEVFVATSDKADGAAPISGEE
jgi:hypothetical protein